MKNRKTDTKKNSREKKSSGRIARTNIQTTCSDLSEWETPFGTVYDPISSSNDGRAIVIDNKE